MPRPTVSVALCTFDGERHLEDQLDSIATQSVRPDEVVICDDRSTDATVAIARRWSERSGLQVHLSVNDERLGSARNFERAISLTTSDLIVLADQDDVWMPEKVARAVAAFAGDDSIGIVFHDATLVDEGLVPLGRTAWQQVHLEGRRRERLRGGRAFEQLVKANAITGMTMAFRARWKPLVLPLPPVVARVGTPYHHDGWIAAVVSAVARIEPLDAELALYRQHTAQQVGLGGTTGRRRASRAWDLGAEHRRWLAQNAVEWVEALVGRLTDADALVPGSTRARHLAAARRHFERRCALPCSRVLRVPVVGAEVVRGHYGRFSGGWQAALLDLAVPAC